MNYQAGALILTAIYIAVISYIGLRSKKQAERSYQSYTIGGKTLPLHIMIFTGLASAFGAGNFVGHGDQAYQIGLSWLVFILGENGALIVFAFTAAALAGRYKFSTAPEMIDNIFVSDKYTRALSGFFLSLPGIAWLGGQAMGIGYIFHLVTGYDPTSITIIAAIAFIVYTTVGGFVAVARTDFFQGGLIGITAIVFYLLSFNQFDFSLSVLGSRAAAIDPGLWRISADSPFGLLSMFFTGLFGMFGLSFWWQRCFAARNVKEAKAVVLISGIVSLIIVPCTALVGIYVRTVNPDLAGGATAWMSWEISPLLGMIMLVLLLAATMSTADSLLNAAAINIVNDVIIPFSSDRSDDQKILYTRIASLLCGGFALLATFFFTRILDLAGLGYTIAGATVTPLIFIGVLAKSQGKFLKPNITRLSVITGGVISIMFQLNPSLSAIFGGGILPGALASFIILLLGMFFFHSDKIASGTTTAASEQ